MGAQRVQDITDQDAMAEGINAVPLSIDETGEGLATQCLIGLLKSIYGEPLPEWWWWCTFETRRI